MVQTEMKGMDFISKATTFLSSLTDNGKNSERGGYPPGWVNTRIYQKYSFKMKTLNDSGNSLFMVDVSLYILFNPAMLIDTEGRIYIFTM